MCRAIIYPFAKIIKNFGLPNNHITEKCRWITLVWNNTPTLYLPGGAVLQNMIFYYTKLRTERILENKKKLVGFARFWRVLYLADYQMVDKYLHFFRPQKQ
jgi:hypothetical protein